MCAGKWKVVLLLLQALHSINSSSQSSCSTYLTDLATNVSYNYDRRELKLSPAASYNITLAECLSDRKERELVIELVSVKLTAGQLEPRPVGPCCRKPCEHTHVQSQERFIDNAMD